MKPLIAFENRQDLQNALLLRAFDEIDEYAIILLDNKGYVMNWNRGAERIKGYRPEEIIGEHFSTFYTPEDQAEGTPFKMLQSAHDWGKAVTEGWRLRRDKTKFWGNVSITAIHDNDHKVIGYIKVTKDLTLVKASQELLKKSEERYQKMIAEVQDYAIILLDADGHVQNWNIGAEKIKGYRSEEIIGHHFSIFYTEQDLRQNVPAKLLKAASVEGRVQHENWRKRKDGTLFWGFVTITSLHDNNGEIIGFSKVTRDLTDKKQTEEQIKHYIESLESKNAELEQFAYIASHDLQEPLRTISSFAELLQINEQHALSAHSLHHLDVIVRAAQRMRQLINGILEYSRISDDSKMQDVDLNVLLNEIKTDLSELIHSQNVVINYNTLPVVNAYPLELRLLLQNLISNAIKFRKKDQPVVIELAADKEEEHWSFYLRDNGIGIPADQHQKIFEIFHRLHGKKDYEGSGIGLAHCKKIIDLHGGKIVVESSSPEGTCFKFTIPFPKTL